MVKKIISIIIALFLASTANCEKKVTCYWSADVDVAQIDPNICTHIIYSFLGLDANGNLNYLWRSEAQALGLIKSLVGLKSKNSKLKAIAAIGGYNDALGGAWSSVAGNSNTRSKFATNVRNFLVNNKLDGIDIDWEYPNHNEDKPQEKASFVLLLKQLKQTLGSSYSLSVAIGSGQWRTGLSYDIPGIFAACDFVNLMSYDLHGSWESKTGIHGALYRSNLDNSALNVDESVKLLLNQGVDRNKLIVGIPTYGNSFTLRNAANNGVGAAATGLGSEKYNSICKKVKSGEYTERWEATQKVPYAFKGTFWIGYDNVKSVTEKANYIKNNNLGGAMFWSIDGDDFSGACSSGKYPLIGAVHKIVVGKETTTESTDSTTNQSITQSTTTSQSTTTQSTTGPFSCPSNGFFKNPEDCSKFYQCWANIAYSFDCPSGLLFNEVSKGCDWPNNVSC